MIGRVQVFLRSHDGKTLELIEADNIVVNSYAQVVTGLLAQFNPTFLVSSEKIKQLTTNEQILGTIGTAKKVSVMVSDNLTWGLTHLAIGDANFIANSENPRDEWQAIKPEPNVARTSLINELGRVFRSGVRFLLFDDSLNDFVEFSTPTNTLEIEFVVNPELFLNQYITELGLFGGKVVTKATPFAESKDVIDPGFMFSHVIFDAPLFVSEQFKNIGLVFLWRLLL